MKQQTKETLWVLTWLVILCLALIGPTAMAQSTDQAVLTWDSSGPLAQEYRMYRAPANSDGTCPVLSAGYSQVGTIIAPTVTYTDGPLDINTSYCWYVTAWNVDHGETGASNVASKRIPFPSLPPAPANLQVR